MFWLLGDYGDVMAVPSRNWGEKIGVNKAHKLLGTLGGAGLLWKMERLGLLERLGEWRYWENGFIGRNGCFG